MYCSMCASWWRGEAALTHLGVRLQYEDEAIIIIMHTWYIFVLVLGVVISRDYN